MTDSTDASTPDQAEPQPGDTAPPTGGPTTADPTGAADPTTTVPGETTEPADAADPADAAGEREDGGTGPTEKATDASSGSRLLDTIRAGYSFEGAALQFGAAVVDGTAHADVPVGIPLTAMNRHGLVAGATGTGKTKTLQLMAEQLVEAGVPVFLADVKGDLSGLASPGEPNEKVNARSKDIGMTWEATAYPTEFYAL
ncbi:MAG: helicase HerA-like domain-containing protein, partial [Phycicoccus sp.]